MLTKRSQFISILFILLAFPAIALAAGGGGMVSRQARGSRPGAAPARVPHARVGSRRVAPAAVAITSRVAPMAVWQRPANHFKRLVKTMSREIRADLRAEVRAASERRESKAFARLPGGVSMATLEAIASCESGGDPAAVSADGTYRGLYQFDQGTWESVGGHGDPAAASAAEQSYRAALLYSRSGSSPWPVCG